MKTLSTRLDRLEAMAGPPKSYRDIPGPALARLVRSMDILFAGRPLTAAEEGELLVLTAAHLEPPESLWGIEDWRAAFVELRTDREAAEGFQAAINERAKHCVESRRFATVKTWGGDDFL